MLLDFFQTNVSLKTSYNSNFYMTKQTCGFSFFLSYCVYMNTDEIKQEVGRKGASLVKDGMIVGLGTGSTATYFIKALSEACQHGLSIQAVSSSKRSFDLAKSLGIPMLEITDVKRIDLTIDGTDEIDPQKRLIKGGGGAHTREKIVAHFSDVFVVIADESKRVQQLGDSRMLPVEIICFGYNTAIQALTSMGYRGEMRTNTDGSFYTTDNGGWILDVEIKGKDIDQVHTNLISLPGVIDTGYFSRAADAAFIGYKDGSIEKL